MLKSFLFVVAVLIGGVAIAWNQGYISFEPDSKVILRTVPVSRGDLFVIISATGTLEPEQVVDVGAQVVGLIKDFGVDPRDPSKPIDYGTHVEQDTVLARIDDSLFQARVDRATSQMDQALAQVEQAQAEIQRAEADLLQLESRARAAEREWERAKKLGPTRTITDTEYDLAHSNEEATKAAVEVGKAAIALAKSAKKRAEKALIGADADLREAKRNLDYTTIRSPVRGIIIDRRVNVGQTVVSNMNAPSLFLIAKDLTRMQIWASVNEADIGQIKPRKDGQPGQVVRFTVDAYPGEVFMGEVAQVRLNATMTQNVVTYTVVIDTENKDGRLLPYLTANVQFECERKTNVLLVPSSSLRWRPRPDQIAPEFKDQYASKSGRSKDAPAKPLDEAHGREGVVWIEDKPYVRPIPVKIGISDGQSTQIVGGDLKEGQPVVVGSMTKVSSEETTNPFTPKMMRPGGGGS